MAVITWKIFFFSLLDIAFALALFRHLCIVWNVIALNSSRYNKKKLGNMHIMICWFEELEQILTHSERRKTVIQKCDLFIFSGHFSPALLNLFNNLHWISFASCFLSLCVSMCLWIYSIWAPTEPQTIMNVWWWVCSNHEVIAKTHRFDRPLEINRKR